MVNRNGRSMIRAPSDLFISCVLSGPATEPPPALAQGCTLIPLPTIMGSEQAGKKSHKTATSQSQHPGATTDSWRQKMDTCQLSNNSTMELMNSERRVSCQLSLLGHEDTEVQGVTQIFINCYQMSLFVS